MSLLPNSYQLSVLRLFSLVLILFLAGCGSGLGPYKSVPEASINQTIVSGFPKDIRLWGDEAPTDIQDVILRRISRHQQQYADYYKLYKSYPPMNYLALSGGGNDGAFGAGLLYGWTETGRRPEFSIVTGVSTGALIAPFAFLGSRYDEVLKREYTTLKSDNIFMGDFWTVFDGLTGGLALTDNSPLSKRLDELITPQLFAEIAAEHKKGRRLLIGTTNVEAQRSMIWNIGAIATSNNPKGLELFKKILLASAAVPGAFAPVFIDVNVDGKEYQETHVDGGVTSQVFLYPLQSVKADHQLFAKYGIKRNLYIIRNAKILPEYKSIRPSIVSLSQRSLETLIKNQGIGDLYRLYIGAYRDGIDYNLAYIPTDYKEQSKEIFDPVYMSKAFALGQAMGKEPSSWHKDPPGVAYLD